MISFIQAGQALRKGAGAYMSATVVIGDADLTFGDVVAVARDGARVELSAAALTALADGRAVVDRLAAAPTPAYGISTGFGALATRHIDPELRAQLQRSLIRSHAAGMGPLVEPEVIRALTLMRLKTLATGHTGVRPVVAETMAALLNAGIVPAVREYGSPSFGAGREIALARSSAIARSIAFSSVAWTSSVRMLTRSTPPAVGPFRSSSLHGTRAHR